MHTPTHTTVADRVYDLEHCICRMAAVPHYMKVCAEKIAEPERTVYLKACEYAERTMRELAHLHRVTLDRPND